MNWSRALDKKATGLAFALGLAAILGALGSQVIGGLVPCELCLEQRMAYYWGLPILAAILVLWNRLPLAVWYVVMAVAAAIFVWGTYMGVYHAGVEWGFWPGPTACTGVPAPRSASTQLERHQRRAEGRPLRRGPVPLPRHFARRLQRADLGRDRRPAADRDRLAVADAEGEGGVSLTARARCPSRDNPASSRGGGWAGRRGRCCGGRAPSAGTAPAAGTS